MLTSISRKFKNTDPYLVLIPPSFFQTTACRNGAILIFQLALGLKNTYGETTHNIYIRRILRRLLDLVLNYSLHRSRVIIASHPDCLCWGQDPQKFIDVFDREPVSAHIPYSDILSYFGKKLSNSFTNLPVKSGTSYNKQFDGFFFSRVFRIGFG